MADLRDFTGKNRKFTGTIGERMSIGTTGQRVNEQGQLRFNSTTNLMEYYTGTDWKPIDSPPSITFITVNGGADTTSGQVDNEAAGNVTIQVKGSLFDTTGGNVTFIGTGETLTPATQTRNNTGLFTCVLPASSFDTPNSPYTVKMVNGSGLSAELVAGLSADQAAPVFITSAGTLGTISNGNRASYSLSTAAATDPDGDTITFSITAGSLPPGLSLNASTAAITGTASAVGSNTTSTFTVSAATTASTTTRQFSITVNAPVVTSFTSTGGFNFSVPIGVTSIDVLVVAGGGGASDSNGTGGGGAGGLIFKPGFTVTPGGTVSGTVGGGGAGATDGSPGSNSTFGTLTAIGGGSAGREAGGAALNGRAGGSGGGGVRGGGSGPGTQPGQPGDSGTFGFGNPGGANVSDGGPHYSGGGGGGAGAAGTNGGSFTPGGTGGAGRSYDISGSSVGYAGGGGGGPYNNASGVGSPNGQGATTFGGGDGGGNLPGTANRGGGAGGGNGLVGGTKPNGGPGVVIVSI